MANTSIKILRSGESGRIPNSMEHGVLALNYADGKLFYKNASNTISVLKNSDSFATINANGSLVMASSSTDILNLIPGDGINIDSSGKNITIAVKNVNNINTINENLISHTVDYTIHNKIISIENANNNVLMDTFDSVFYRTAEYTIQAKNGSIVHVSKIILTHDDADLFFTEPYELLSQNIRLYNFDAVFNDGNVEVYLTSTANTNFKISRSIIPT